MHKLEKQPSEVYVFVSIDFSSRLAEDETVTTGNVAITLTEGTDEEPLSLTATDISGSEGKLGATLSGGLDGCKYKLTYSATGTSGNVLESELLVTVKEK